MNNEKDYIIELLSHDLKEPFNSVDGLLEIIMQGEETLSAHQFEGIDHIKKTVAKSRDPLERILMAKEQQHFLPKLNLERINLCELGKDSIASFRAYADNKYEEIDKLFNMYSRLSSRHTMGETSSGLGLSLVKGYVNRLGTHIWYKSRKPPGANFILLTPLY